MEKFLNGKITVSFEFIFFSSELTLYKKKCCTKLQIVELKN